MGGASPAGLVRLDDATVLAGCLETNPLLNLYLLGDLDPFFWPRTAWFGWRRQAGGPLGAVLLIYSGLGEPTVLLCCREAALPDARALLQAVAAASELPRRFHAHFSPGCGAVLEERGWLLAHRGRALRMGLRDRTAHAAIDTEGVERLSSADLGALNRLYAASYPENWFDAGMLETGRYFGVRHGGELLSVAGVHVFSARYGVAALGNVTTATAARRQGLGTRTTARLCSDLLTVTPHIGLNVHATNAAAVACYRKLGFDVIVPFDEYAVEAAGATRQGRAQGEGGR